MIPLNWPQKLPERLSSAADTGKAPCLARRAGRPSGVGAEEEESGSRPSAQTRTSLEPGRRDPGGVNSGRHRTKGSGQHLTEETEGLPAEETLVAASQTPWHVSAAWEHRQSPSDAPSALSPPGPLAGQLGGVRAAPVRTAHRCPLEKGVLGHLASALRRREGERTLLPPRLVMRKSCTNLRLQRAGAAL